MWKTILFTTLVSFFLGVFTTLYTQRYAPEFKLRQKKNTSYDYLVQLADSYAKRYHIPSPLFRAVIKVESNWNISAISSQGAVGLGQLMLSAADDCGLSAHERYNPEKNLKCSAWHLARHKRNWKSWRNALYAYNWGHGNLSRKGKHNAPRETRRYADMILKKWQKAQNKV